MSSAQTGNGTVGARGRDGAAPALAGPREWTALAVLVLPVILISVDSTVNRAHQHATNTTRTTGGPVESQESGRRTA